MNVLWLDLLKSKQIALNYALFCELSKPDKITIHFGSMKKSMDVLIRNDLPEKTIGLPKNLSDIYTIPTELPYECILKGGQVYIGPVIAFVVLGSFSQLNNRTLSIYLPRFQEYDKIKGLIFVCTKETIHVNHSLVEGYYYDPEGNKIGNPWKYGKFPLPNSVFNRSFLSQKTIGDLRAKIGDTIFNSYWYALNKWLIWKNLSNNKVLKNHLPYTEQFKGLKQLHALLDKYHSVYIKPYCLSRGRGVLSVSKYQKSLIVTDEKGRKFYLKNDKSAAEFFKEKVRHPSIVQQAVPYKIGDRCLDLRVYLQKDETKQWTYTALLGKLSRKGNVVTNVHGGGAALLGRDALCTYYNIDHKTAEKIENKMVDIVKMAVQIYEKKGLHLGDIGADVILDSKFNIWLLEIQLNHGVDKVPDVLPPSLFKVVMLTPFKYAKALAGFCN